MILSASRRTDIPCFYSDWLLNRLNEGFVLVRNPFRPSQVTRVPLSAKTTDCIVFWTKDPANLLPRLDEIDQMQFRYYFQFTLTPYGKEIERGLRDKASIVETFLSLSEKIGKDRVIWRYDPIFLSKEISVTDHEESFLKLCRMLSLYTNRVTISFLDQYRKCNRTCSALGLFAPNQREIDALCRSMGSIAAEYGLSISACCEDMDFAPYGISAASCIDEGIIRSICGSPLTIPKDRSQRTCCGCVQSVDIGAYDTCLNGCAYCYATRSPSLAQTRFAQHRTQGGLLCGELTSGDAVIEKKVTSYRR